MHKKNQKLRIENQAVGFLGQYAIGEGENFSRVEQASKDSSSMTKARAHATLEMLSPPMSTKSSGGKMIKLKKPNQLQPLPFEIKESDVKYMKKGHQRLNSIAGSAASHSNRMQHEFRSGAPGSRKSSRRILKIRGMPKGKDFGKKERFNEEVDEEIRSIRETTSKLQNQRLNAIALSGKR